MPDSLPCTIEALNFEGIYLVDDNQVLHFIIFESSKDEDNMKVYFCLIFQIFGMANAIEASRLSEFPYLEDNPLNLKVNYMIEECRRLKHDYNHQIKFWLIE
jgi:hypothetical protein